MFLLIKEMFLNFNFSLYVFISYFRWHQLLRVKKKAKYFIRSTVQRIACCTCLVDRTIVPMSIHHIDSVIVRTNSIVGKRMMGSRKVILGRVVGRRASRMDIHPCRRLLQLEQRVIEHLR